MINSFDITVSYFLSSDESVESGMFSIDATGNKIFLSKQKDDPQKGIHKVSFIRDWLQREWYKEIPKMP